MMHEVQGLEDPTIVDMHYITSGICLECGDLEGKTSTSA